MLKCASVCCVRFVVINLRRCGKPFSQCAAKHRIMRCLVVLADLHARAVSLCFVIVQCYPDWQLVSRSWLLFVAFDNNDIKQIVIIIIF